MSFRILGEPGTPPLVEVCIEKSVDQVGQTTASESFVFRCPNCNRHVLNGLKTCPCGQRLNWG